MQVKHLQNSKRRRDERFDIRPIMMWLIGFVIFFVEKTTDDPKGQINRF